MKVRTILKIILITSVISLCIGVAIFLYFRMSATERAKDFDLYTLVPANSKLIVDTDNVINLMQGINELSFSKDQRFLYFSRFFVYLKDHVNTLQEDTPHGLSRQMNKMLISFHEPNSDLDQVFYCRLGTGDYELVEQLVSKYLTVSFSARFFDYRGEEIRIYPMPGDSFLACYVTTEFMAVSYQKKLIEQVIDARLSGKSILSDKSFAKVREAHRMVTPATIYADMHAVDMGKRSDALHYQSNLGKWTELNVNFSDEATYLSGISYDVDSCNTFVNALRAMKPVEGFSGDMLPSSTFFFAKISVSNLDSLLNFTSTLTYTQATYSNAIMEGDELVGRLLKEYAGDAATTCMFHADDSLALSPHVVWSVPLRHTVGIKRALAHIYRSVPLYEGLEPIPEIAHFSASALYAAYALPRNTVFARLTGVTNSSLLTYACIYKNRLLVSPDVASLQAYIEAVEEKASVLEGTPVYEDIMASLSPSYHFVMMGDMEEILDQPEGYVRFIPSLFFRYSKFFRHFIITSQFTCVDQIVYPNLILTYKGTQSVED